ncbi:MAG: MFS transporter [Acidimicrobiia bacterium]|nr:MFS transporter [Acidimicrobiia bacterium]MBT8217755.1 MFS transporter [Acidimicrobiia bacterium]NNF10907.1 MFS transporter [Acidimicrobiia bacterium]NNL71634.1 MFS transporter [Acidimicrobiia bacterium]
MSRPSDEETDIRRRLGANYWRLWVASVVSNVGDGVAQIAYPWLASAVTRVPLLIAVIAVVQRLPWLVFTLPAGVITDRVDRRKIMVAMDLTRMVITLGVALAVAAEASGLPAPDEIGSGVVAGTNTMLYLALLGSALLFGMAEVLRDNAAQTILPAIVEPESLERANGRLWGAEMVANSFAGPPLGSLLIGVLFALPFFVDAGTFALAAGLIFLMKGNFQTTPGEGKVAWRQEISEGFRWLWRHEVLRPMAIILGLLNGLGMMTFATFVLFAQEVLGVDAFAFALLMTAGAAGGVIGSVSASAVSKRLGSGTSLVVVLVGSVITSFVIGTAGWWPIVWIMFAASSLLAVLWNVITVSFRQTIIPDALLGRVNSVYRFFGWGMMPIGLFVGGAIVSGVDLFASREVALRVPWLAAAASYVVLAIYAAPKLTTEKLESARTTAVNPQPPGH